jgi:hypothetical protein
MCLFRAKMCPARRLMANYDDGTIEKRGREEICRHPQLVEVLTRQGS